MFDKLVLAPGARRRQYGRSVVRITLTNQSTVMQELTNHSSVSVILTNQSTVMQ